MSDTIQERVREAAEGPAGYYCATTLYEAADEIDRLRAELDEKDKRIAELEAECDETTRKIDYLASNEVVILTEDINAAWEWANLPEKNIQKLERRRGLERLGIVACKKCGGTGDDRGDVLALVYPCRDCNGKGWVWRNDD